MGKLVRSSEMPRVPEVKRKAKRRVAVSEQPTKKIGVRQLEFLIFAYYCKSSSSHGTMWMVPLKSAHRCDQNAVSIMSFALMVVEIS